MSHSIQKPLRHTKPFAIAHQHFPVKYECSCAEMGSEVVLKRDAKMCWKILSEVERILETLKRSDIRIVTHLPAFSLFHIAVLRG